MNKKKEINFKLLYMKDAFLKSPFTTAIGVILISFLGYKLFFLGGDMDLNNIIQLLMSVGLIGTKDAWSSHTKGTNATTGPTRPDGGKS